MDMDAPAVTPPRSWFRRALAPVLGLLLCIPASYATANLPQSSMFSLLAAPVAILMVLAGLNALFTWGRPGRGLQPGELAIVFAMIAAASAMSAEWTFYMHATAHQLPFIAPGNPAVKDTILPNLPDWMVVKDLKQVQDMQAGGRDAAYVASKLPIFGAKFSLPDRAALAGKLIAGAVLFGIGWGVAGLCPGPAIASLALSPAAVLPFVGAMLVGMFAQKLVFDREVTQS